MLPPEATAILAQLQAGAEPVDFEILRGVLVFLHRKLGGIFQLLKRLDLELDLRPYWDRLIQAND